MDAADDLQHPGHRGSCTIGLKIDADAGVWGFIDDFELTKAK